MAETKFSKAFIKLTDGLFTEATGDASSSLMAFCKVGFVLGQYG
jgi:hypothetical protein